MCRHQVSALAGLSCLLYGINFPCFDPNPIAAKRTKTSNLALSFFCTENRHWLAFRWRQYSSKVSKQM
ncbi:hypothetical protein BD408DRAFT_410958 [Parasitella parasitica]|nr:hypothetical protein BD408DRAFT_410958 [Parasitella parasitica]